MAKKQAHSEQRATRAQPSPPAPAPAPAPTSTGNNRPVRMGGSFAPPLSLEKVAQYRELAQEAPPEVAEIMVRLCDMVTAFHETPASNQPRRAHPSGTGFIVQLEPKEIQRMDPHVPWPRECDHFAVVFEELPTGTSPGPVREHQTGEGRTYLKQTSNVTDEKAKAIRDAAFHLLWFARELSMDREPPTTDRLGIGEYAEGAMNPALKRVLDDANPRKTKEQAAGQAAGPSAGEDEEETE